jgi:tetratricopeptide (TPR) repeat protein
MSELNIFVNRENELNFINQLITHFGNKSDLVFFYAEGAVGKTYLMQKIQNIYKHSDDRLLVTNIIDFDESDLDTTSDLGVRIAKELDEKMHCDLIDFWHDYEKMQGVEISSERLAEEFEKGERMFVDSFNRFSSEKLIVLLFDTIEKVKGSGYLQYWFSIFKRLNNYVCFISGRNAQHLIESVPKNKNIKIHDYELFPLSDDYAQKYLHEVLKRYHIKMEQEYIEAAIFIAQGKPILIDLFVIWYSHGISPDFSLSLPLDQNDKKFRARIEEELVSFIIQTRTNLESLILLMHHVNPLDIDMIGYFLNLPYEKAEKLFDETKKYTFIKSLPDKRIMLHDEMYRLVNDYIWEKVDPEKIRRLNYSESAIEYFGKKLNLIKHEIDQNSNSAKQKRRSMLERDLSVYKAEQLKHYLFINSDQAVNYFVSAFDDATKSNRLNLREMYLNTMPQELGEFHLQEKYQIVSRRIEHTLYTRQYSEGAKLCNDILKEKLPSEYEVDILCKSANIEIRLFHGNYEAAINLFEKAVSLSEANQLHIWTIKSLTGLGWAYRLKGDLEFAREIYFKARNLCLQEGGLENEELKYIYGWISNNLVFVLSDKYESRQQAIDIAESIIEYWEAIENHEGLGAAHLVKGNAYYRSDLYEYSAASYEKAKKLFKELGYDEWLGQVFSWEGLLYQDMGPNYFDKAEKSLNKALEIEYPNIKTMTIYRKGRLFFLKGDLDKAEEYLSQSYNLSEQTSDYRYKMGSLGMFAHLSAKKGQFYRLTEYKEKIMKCKEIINNPEDDVLYIAYTGLAALCIGNANSSNISIMIEYLKKAITLLTYTSYKRAEKRLRFIENLFQQLDNPETIRFIGKTLNQFIADKEKENTLYSTIKPLVYRWINWK